MQILRKNGPLAGGPESLIQLWPEPRQCQISLQRSVLFVGLSLYSIVFCSLPEAAVDVISDVIVEVTGVHACPCTIWWFWFSRYSSRSLCDRRTTTTPAYRGYHIRPKWHTGVLPKNRVLNFLWGSFTSSLISVGTALGYCFIETDSENSFRKLWKCNFFYGETFANPTWQFSWIRTTIINLIINGSHAFIFAINLLQCRLSFMQWDYRCT